MTESSRRLGERILINEPGRLLDARSNVTDCRVLDVSEYGARIGVACHANVPRRFTLEFRDKLHNVEFVWRRENKIGVRLVLDEPAPSGAPAGSQAGIKPHLSVAQLRKLVAS